MFRAVPGILVLLAAVLASDPARASVHVGPMAPRPCPDLSQIPSFGRPHGAAAADGRGGAFVLWADDRAISIQRFGPSGRIADGWPAPGLALGWIAPGEEGFQSYVAGDGSGGAMVSWIGREGELRLQRVTSACGVSSGWPAEGLVLCSLPGLARNPEVVMTDTAAAMVIWREQEINGTQSMRLSRVMTTGRLAEGWSANGRVLATGELQQIAELVADGRGGAIAYWQGPSATEGRAGLVLQRVQSNGDIASGWPAEGRVIADRLELGLRNDEENGFPQLAPDGKGGAWLVWCADRLAGPDQVRVDLMVLRVTGEGREAPGWPAGGRTIAGDAVPERRPVIATDGEGLLVAWRRDEGNGAIRVARVETAGMVRSWGQWSARSVERLTIAPDGSGGAWVACTTPDHSPQLVRWNPGGPGRTIEAGEPSSATGADPTRLSLVTEGARALVVWCDTDPGPPARRFVRVSGTHTRGGP